jgi:hypothetical protein
MKMSKAQALALRELVKAEAALVNDDWAAVRDAAIRLAALSADRTGKSKRQAIYQRAARTWVARLFLEG